MQMLHEKFSGHKEMMGEEVFADLVPDYVLKNLNPKFEIRDYQKEALGRFEFFINEYPGKPKNQPLNVLYHMATGSGKTLIMAGEILALYKRGYRHFIFFVNSTNIIKKTKENFLNKASSKYLFNACINIDGRPVEIREVENFSSTNSDDINIFFTTIQGLHSLINFPRENCLSLEDFEERKVALFSDEAHHINVETKRNKSTEELITYNSWESTVKRIFHANKNNLMLEFTATAELNDPEINEKYKDVVLFDYPLKKFRLDGYSKEVKVLQSDSEPYSRALQAIVLSQYRRKVFEKHKLLIKPVVLFKSRTIKESKQYYSDFIEAFQTLSAQKLEDLKHQLDNKNIVFRAFDYFERNNISLESIALELSDDFSSEKIIEVNSKDNMESQQLLLNSLEDADNQIRAIFAVDKLNEGWDVLNLFDIVRLYDVRSPKETTREAQLIGRGARYCPFRLSDDQPLYQRKYDILENTSNSHELKVCEELYYHSAHNPKYIQELNQALREIGITPQVSRELSLCLKESFKQTNFYKYGFVYKNERVAIDRSQVSGLEQSLIDANYRYSIKTGASSELAVFETSKSKNIELKTSSVRLLALGKHVVKKALSSFPDFQYHRLRFLFPNLKSLEEFIESKNYLGDIHIKISGNQNVLDDLPQSEKLNAAKTVLYEIAQRLDDDRIDFRGSLEFKQDLVSNVFTDKTLNIVNDGLSDQEFGISQASTSNVELAMDLSSRDWFGFNDNYGTSEEKYLVKFIDEMIDDLKNQYEEVYLLRNEKHLKIYSFDDGRPFEPDFILFLSKNKNHTEVTYQVFIEPKGDHLMEKDDWKQKFLLELKSRHKIAQVWKGKHFTVWGLPFYNKSLESSEFAPAFSDLLTN